MRSHDLVRLTGLLCTVAGLICLIPAGSLAAEAAPEGPPVLRLDRRLHDFGAVESGRPLETVFTITNAGGELLKIQAIRTGRGIQATSSETELAPGASGSIQVMLKGHLIGAVERRVTLLTNDPAHPRSRLILRASIQPVLALSERSAQFGEIPWDKITSHRVDLVGTGLAQVGEIQVVPLPAGKQAMQVNPILARIKSRVVDERSSGGGLALELSLGPDLPSGSFRGRLRITTGHPQIGELELGVRGLVRGLVTVQPERVVFIDLMPGKSQERILKVLGPIGQDLTVLGIHTEHPSLQATFEQESQGVWQIRLVCDGRLERNREKANLFIQTDRPHLAQLTVPVRMKLAPPVPPPLEDQE